MAHDDERRTLYVSPHVEALLGLHPRGVARAARHLDRAPAPRRPRDRARRARPASRDGRAVVAGVPADRGRRPASSGSATSRALVPTAMARSTWQGVLLDITAQKHAEEALRLTHDELEHRVLARTAELEEANELMELEVGERRRAEARGPRRRGAVPPPRRGHAGGRLPVGHCPTTSTTRRGVREPGDRGRCSATRAASGAPSTCGASGCTRTTATGSWPRSSAARPPASRSTIEYRYLAKDGRDRVGLDRATLIAARRRRHARALPGRHARRHRAQGGRGARPPRPRPGSASCRARPGGHLRVLDLDPRRSAASRTSST